MSKIFETGLICQRKMLQRRWITLMAGSGTACACSCTGGNSVRNVVNLFVIFGLIVLAAYSSLSDASQHGTML